MAQEEEEEEEEEEDEAVGEGVEETGGSRSRGREEGKEGGEGKGGKGGKGGVSEKRRNEDRTVYMRRRSYKQFGCHLIRPLIKLGLVTWFYSGHTSIGKAKRCLL